MTKHKFSFVILAVCFLLVVSMLFGCNNTPGESEYNLTVQDPNGYLIENVQKRYKAGEEVTVKTEVLSDADLVAYLDNDFVGFGTLVEENDENHWEYYFVMPSHNAVLSLELFEDSTETGIALDKATQIEIITAFVNAHSKDYYPVSREEISLRCYGAFDGVYVLFVDVASWGMAAVEKIEIIAGVKFVYPDPRTMTVYSDNSFYTIAEAYDNNILSYNNLLTTQETYKAANAFLYENDNEDGKAFNETVQRKIITDFVSLHSEDYYPVTEDEISLRCYGAFDGVYVLFVDVASWAYPDVIEEDVIAGVKFIYSCGQTMKVYSDGAFYTISEAYENNILSYNNLLTTQETYKAANAFLYEND